MSKMAQAISSRFSVVLAIGVLLTWVVCVPAVVRADDPSQRMMRGGHPEHGRAMYDFVGDSLHRLLRHGKDLGLSQEQRAKIKAIATDYTKTRIREEADLKLAEVDARTLIHDEKADLAAIETALKKSESTHTALRLDGVKALRAAAAVLTPEQREKWRAIRMARRGERHAEGLHSERANPSSASVRG
jgi:Spy/CpxP family protein refolding chaperone